MLMVRLRSPTALHPKKIAIALLIILLLTCSDIDGLRNKEDNKRKTDTLFLYLAQERNKGNCLHKDSSTETVYCDRRSSGICNANDLILTSGEKTYNLSEGNNLVRDIPSCRYSFLNSGIASETITSYAEEDTIRANNLYSVVDSCEATGITSTATLLSESEFLFTNSPKGRIAVAADKLTNTPDSILLVTLKNLSSVKQVKSDALDCLEVGFSQLEKELISDLRTGKKTKELSCSTKAGAANGCP